MDLCDVLQCRVDLMMLVFAVPTDESGVSRVSHTVPAKTSLFSIRRCCHTQHAEVGVFSYTLGCSFCGGLSTVSSFINEVRQTPNNQDRIG